MLACGNHHAVRDEAKAHDTRYQWMQAVEIAADG
jgi:hypothetical protein